ncbi:hypothetical protein A8U91_01407 [Halomonas elongata]|uniref:Uncharacterized protein n=1 Tax=Halomonas elongata TaxID=2746 RepID=A0A1B8P4A1_HALEL|nr:hypothetical protein A8U91_01407 [Halomonas elongata]
MPIRRRARRKSRPRMAARSLSPNLIVPDEGSTRRLMQRIRVDLPAPEGPISPITWPCGTWKVTLRRAVSPEAPLWAP